MKLKKKHKHLILAIALSIAIAMIVPYSLVKPLESALFTIATAFIAVAITLYGLISSIAVPLIVSYHRAIADVNFDIQLVVRRFNSMLNELFEGVIGVLIIFCLSFILPFLKTPVKLAIADNPEAIIFLIQKTYEFILFLSVALIIGVTLDMILTIRQLNTLHLAIISSGIDNDPTARLALNSGDSNESDSTNGN